MAKCCTVGAVTVRSVEPVMLPSFAEIVDVPAATAVTSPLPEMVAADAAPEVQVTWLVMF